MIEGADAPSVSGGGRTWQGQYGGSVLLTHPFRYSCPTTSLVPSSIQILGLGYEGEQHLLSVHHVTAVLLLLELVDPVQFSPLSHVATSSMCRRKH